MGTQSDEFSDYTSDDFGEDSAISEEQIRNERKAHIFKIKLASNAGSDLALKEFKEFALFLQKNDLSVVREELSILQEIFKKKYAAISSDWRKTKRLTLLYTEEQIPENTETLELYRKQVAQSLIDSCQNGIQSLLEVLVGVTQSEECHIILLKLKADNLYYLQELTSGVIKYRIMKLANETYKEVIERAEKTLQPYDSVWITAVIHQCANFFESCKPIEEIIETLEQLDTAASETLESVPENEFAEVKNAMRHLQATIAHYREDSKTEF